MTKYPKTVWVVFWKGEPLKIYKVRVTKNSYVSGQSVKRYHLHPGNEVARALNILRGDVWYYNLNTTDKDVAMTLRDNGIRVRWDAKAGKFL